MKAPDKIYIPLYPNYSLDGFHLADEWMYQPHKEVENVKYICKDALLELLKPEKDICFCDDYERGCIDGRNGLVEELLDKLNEM